MCPHSYLTLSASLIKGDLSKRIDEIENVETVFKAGIGYDSKKLIDNVPGRSEFVSNIHLSTADLPPARLRPLATDSFRASSMSARQQWDCEL
jgi:hypothetical protein